MFLANPVPNTIGCAPFLYLSNSMDVDFCVEALDEALELAIPETFETDQGAQFTSREFTGRLLNREVAISMNGKGRAIDNVMIERRWQTLKYEEIYLKEYLTGTDLRKGIRGYFDYFCKERRHQSLDRQTPAEVCKTGQSKCVAISLLNFPTGGPKNGVHFTGPVVPRFASKCRNALLSYMIWRKENERPNDNGADSNRWWDLNRDGDFS